ncbi:hypothetical protein AB0M87_23790 [Streptomyces sp. NPDC051320]|uniref:hypothetical protein n=1 Tax=Streptomyces sp. NPDC051320 TaxID=3154644 RepID=UPI00341F4FFC
MSDFDEAGRPDRSTTAAAAKTAQDKAAEGAQVVSDKATAVTDTAKEQAAGVANEAAAQAGNLVSEVRSQLQDQADSQTQRLAGNVRRLADELGRMSDSGEPDSSAAKAVRKIADGGQQAAAKLESRGPEGLLSDLQGFARRRPGVFLAGAALAGFAVARAGKGVGAAGSDGDGSRASTGGTGAHRAAPWPEDTARARRPAPGPVLAPPPVAAPSYEYPQRPQGS